MYVKQVSFWDADNGSDFGEWRLMLPQFRTLSRDRDAGRLQCPLGQLGRGVFTMEIRAARNPSGVLTGLPNARRTSRGPVGVIADMSNPYLSTPVMLAELISVAFEKALQQSTMASA